MKVHAGDFHFYFIFLVFFLANSPFAVFFFHSNSWDQACGLICYACLIEMKNSLNLLTFF